MPPTKMYLRNLVEFALWYIKRWNDDNATPDGVGDFGAIRSTITECLRHSENVILMM
ncbi:MAG: hypothetical protein ACRC10_03760 [Thermoguttaceae bacterium]